MHYLLKHLFSLSFYPVKITLLLMQYLYEELNALQMLRDRVCSWTWFVLYSKFERCKAQPTNFVLRKKNCAKHQKSRPYMKQIRDYTEKKAFLKTFHTFNHTIEQSMRCESTPSGELLAETTAFRRTFLKHYWNKSNHKRWIREWFEQSSQEINIRKIKGIFHIRLQKNLMQCFR